MVGLGCNSGWNLSGAMSIAAMALKSVHRLRTKRGLGPPLGKRSVSIGVCKYLAAYGRSLKSLELDSSVLAAAHAS